MQCRDPFGGTATPKHRRVETGDDQTVDDHNGEQRVPERPGHLMPHRLQEVMYSKGVEMLYITVKYYLLNKTFVTLSTHNKK